MRTAEYPGMNANFQITRWNFSKHPLSWRESEKDWEPYKIAVTTTRMTHELDGHTNQMFVTTTVSASDIEVVPDR
jgi:hypothetical protein